MFHPGVCIIAVILTSTWASDVWDCSDTHEGPCKRMNQCRPLVTPMNSTHLRVNWENVFEEGCEDGFIEKMEIETKEETTTVTHKKVKLSQKETFVKANPCLQHIIYIKLFMTGSYSANHSRSFVTTPAMEYNKIEQESDNYPFGGLLSTTVVPEICLKANGTIVIQSPPEALKNCGVESGDIKDSDFDEVGATGKVRVSFKNPQNPSTKYHKNYIVKDIKACTRESNDDNSLVIAVAVIVTLIVLGLIVTIAIICWKRQGKAKSREINREVDANPVYGIYALNDEGEDIGVSELRDTNVYYAM